LRGLDSSSNWLPPNAHASAACWRNTMLVDQRLPLLKNQEWGVSLLRMRIRNLTAVAAPLCREGEIICIGKTLIFVPCTVITFGKDLNIRVESGFSDRIIS